MSNSIKIALFFALSVACFAQPGPRPSGGGGSSGVTSFNTRTGAVVSVSGDVSTALGFVPLSPTVSTNAALKAALDATNSLGASAFTALSFQTNVATKAAQDATNGLGSAAFSASSAFQSALGFTPLTPAVSTNAATKAALDATNGLGSAAFTASGAYQAALGFTPLTPTVSTNAALKAAQDATNGLGASAFTALSFQTNVATKAAQDATNGLSSGAFAAAGASAGEAYITIANTAGLSAERALAGTANQITLTDGGANGSLTLSLPQNIHTAATPQFARMGFGVAADATAIINLWQAIATGTSTPGAALTNTTVATVGAQAFSPFIEQDGNGWKTTATAGSQPVGTRFGAIPIQAATSPSVMWRLQSSTNGSGFKTLVEFDADNGQTNANRYLNIGGGLLLTGPAGTSLSTVNAGVNQLRLTAATSVTLALGGVDVMSLVSGQFAADSAADGTYILGSSGARWRQVWHYNNRVLSADQTSTSASMASTTLATGSLPGTWRYHFSMVLYVTNTVAADGVSIDFNQGTATMTQFRADVQIYDSTGLIKSQQTTALATAISAATLTGDGSIKADISFIPNSGGTFIPRFAVNAHTTGTLTVRKDSCLLCTDLVP